ncbi:MAG: shikimate dehydrogenase [Bacteroidaceae bacterium]|nr:shikimate dehydrogenase [Bacteroidaceae bacterium]
MDTYGLIGYPLGHSFSKGYFTRFFEEEQIGAEYKNFELPKISELTQVLSEETTLRGFNVTIPYKQQVMTFLDEVDPAAIAIGAVNVVKVTRHEGKLHLKGYNTDAIGFADSIRPLLKPHHTHALILGTGGASKAVDYALRQMGIETRFVSRTPSADTFSYADLTPEVLRHYTVIVNTTPLGMHPKVDACPPLDYSQLSERHLLFDAVYNPAKTKFLQQGEQAGATICNGMEMLIGQAKAAWRIWNER